MPSTAREATTANTSERRPAASGPSTAGDTAAGAVRGQLRQASFAEGAAVLTPVPPPEGGPVQRLLRDAPVQRDEDATRNPPGEYDR